MHRGRLIACRSWSPGLVVGFRRGARRCALRRSTRLRREPRCRRRTDCTCSSKMRWRGLPAHRVPPGACSGVSTSQRARASSVASVPDTMHLPRGNTQAGTYAIRVFVARKAEYQPSKVTVTYPRVPSKVTWNYRIASIEGYRAQAAQRTGSTVVMTAHSGLRPPLSGRQAAGSGRRSDSHRWRAGRAAGQVVEVMGARHDSRGPTGRGRARGDLAGDAYGRYTHPSDWNPAPADPNFDGFAVLRADVEGRCRFKTIKSGAYPEDSGAMPAPHIHFEVLGSTNRLVADVLRWRATERHRPLPGYGRWQQRMSPRFLPALFRTAGATAS